MREEVVHFFREVFDENLPLILSSSRIGPWPIHASVNFTVYPNRTKEAFKKFPRPEHNRGGLSPPVPYLDSLRMVPSPPGSSWSMGKRGLFGKTPLPLRPMSTRSNPILRTAPKPPFVKNWKLTPRIQIVRPVTKTLIHWAWPLINSMQSGNGDP